MANLAKSDNISKINETLKDAYEFFIGNMTTDSSLQAYKYQQVDGQDKSLFDKMTDLDFLSKNDKNNKDLNPLKEAIEQIKEFFDNRDLKDNKQPFDYDEFKEKVGNNISKAENSLDTFNKNNDYKNITSPGMRMFRAFLDKLDSVNINIETIKREEPINEIQNEIDFIENQKKQNDRKADQMLKYCATNEIVYDNFESDYKKANYIDTKMNEMQTKLNGIEETLDGKKTYNDIEFYNLYNDKLSIRLAELEYDELTQEKKNAYNEFSEIANKRASENKDLAAEYMLSYMDLHKLSDELFNIEVENKEDFQANFDKFKKEFIQKDPERTNNLLSDKEKQEYINKINNYDYDSLKNFIEDSIETYRNDILKEKDINPELLDKFKNADNARSRASSKFDELVELDEKYSEKEEKLYELKPEYKESFEQVKNSIKELDTKEKVNELKSTIPEKINNLLNADKQVDTLNDISNLYKDQIKSVEYNLPDLKDHINKMNSVKNDINQIKENDTAIKNKRNSLISHVVNADINTQKENMMRGKLERFASQFSQCKRAGHSDSKEFLNMQKAVNDCLKDMSPDNIKAMQKAADDYTTAKSGGWNLFNTKMRRHRLDLAHSISEFSKTCEKSFGNQQKYDQVKELTEKANDVLKDSNNSSIEKAKEYLNTSRTGISHNMSDKINMTDFAIRETVQQVKEKLTSLQTPIFVKEEKVNQNQLNNNDPVVQNKQKANQEPAANVL